MDTLDWSERLANNRDSLSRRELDLIDWVVAHPHEAAFERLQGLADRAEVSKPTVISCYRRLGFEDYQAFQSSIQEFYAGQIDSYRAGTVALKHLASTAEVLGACLDVEIAAIETLRKNLDPSELEVLADSVLAAKGVYLYGDGTGFYPGHYLAQRLRRCGISAALVGTDREHAVDDLGAIGAGDVFLSFYYTQDALVLLRLMDFAAERGARSVIVTGFLDPELCGRADQRVYVPRGHIRFKNSMAVPMAFAQILLMAVEFRGGERIAERLRLLEIARKGIIDESTEESR